MRNIMVLVVCAFVLAAAAPAGAEPVAKKDSQAWQWKWQAWLPDKWQRIGACETGYGKRPGNWKHNSGSYQGAFGFAVSSWDAFRLPGYPSEAYNATPWQQYRVALEIYKRYGLSGWGCRNA